MIDTLDDDCQVIRGSGNVFRDFGRPDADVHQAKALLAAQIIKVVDDENLSTRQAESRTGITHCEFVRIRRVNRSISPGSRLTASSRSLASSARGSRCR